VPVLSNRRRRLDPDSRQEEILKAALALFADRPADQVSVEEVAAAAAASPALVHHYFGSRAQLVHAVLRATADELIGMLTVDAAAPAVAQLATGLTIYLDYLERHPQSWTALLRAGYSTHDPTAAIAAAVDDHAMAIALRAVHPRGTPPTALELALRGWLAFVKDACLRWLQDGALQRAALQQLLAAAFVGCLEAAAAADERAGAALERFSSGR
jgi:AcrR family transcriptional regulator